MNALSEAIYFHFNSTLLCVYFVLALRALLTAYPFQSVPKLIMLCAAHYILDKALQYKLLCVTHYIVDKALQYKLLCVTHYIVDKALQYKLLCVTHYIVGEAL